MNRTRSVEEMAELLRDYLGDLERLGADAFAVETAGAMATRT